MSLRQIYYTSCRSGLRGSPGFQIHAATPGIAAAVLQQVERLCVYVPPVSAPSRPGPGELEQFPLSLIYQRLQDGTMVLAQARYIGADYSGRFGNYFAHSLVSSTTEPELAELLPIQLWRSALWCAREVETTELPEAGAIGPHAALALPQVFRFLADSGRLEHLAAFVTAVEQALRTKRRIVIVDTSDAVALLIAAACFVLPRHLVLRLTFNTYVKSPYQTDALVVGTTVDSDFGFAPHEIRHTVFLFDFVGNRFTPIEELSPLGRLAEAAYRTGRPELLAGYADFAAKVEPELTLDDAAVALAAYCRPADITVPGIDSTQIAAWCGSRLARLPTERIGPLFTQLLAGAAGPNELRVALTLMKAAVAATLPPPSQVAAAELAVGWTVRVAVPKLGAEELVPIVEALLPLPELRTVAARHPFDWLGRIRDTKEPVLLLLYVLIGECLGGLDGGDSLLSETGEKLIGPALTTAAVQRALRLLAGRSGGRPLIHGVAVYLLGQVRDPAWFLGLEPLLISDELAKELASWSVQNQSLLLHFRVQGSRVRSAPERRSAAFAQCLDGVTRAGEPLTGELCQSALDAVWLESSPAFEDALQILAAVPPAVLGQTRLPAQLARRLAQCTTVSPIKDVQRELASQLGSGGLRGSLGESAVFLDLFDAAVRLGQPDWPDHVVGALSCVQRVGLEVGDGVCQLAADKLSQRLELPQYETLVRDCFAACPLFGQAYFAAMECRVHGAEPLTPATVARLLQCWLALERSAAHEAIGGLLIDRVLLDATRKWGRKERAAVRALVSHDEAARSRLRALWAAKDRRQRRRWLVFGALLLLMAASGLMLWMARTGHPVWQRLVGLVGGAGAASPVAPR